MWKILESQFSAEKYNKLFHQLLGKENIGQGPVSSEKDNDTLLLIQSFLMLGQCGFSEEEILLLYDWLKPELSSIFDVMKIRMKQIGEYYERSRQQKDDKNEYPQPPDIPVETPLLHRFLGLDDHVYYHFKIMLKEDRSIYEKSLRDDGVIVLLSFIPPALASMEVNLALIFNKVFEPLNKLGKTDGPR